MRPWCAVWDQGTLFLYKDNFAINTSAAQPPSTVRIHHRDFRDRRRGKAVAQKWHSGPSSPPCFCPSLPRFPSMVVKTLLPSSSQGLASLQPVYPSCPSCIAHPLPSSVLLVEIPILLPNPPRPSVFAVILRRPACSPPAACRTPSRLFLYSTQSSPQQIPEEPGSHNERRRRPTLPGVRPLDPAAQGYGFPSSSRGNKKASSPWIMMRRLT